MKIENNLLFARNRLLIFEAKLNVEDKMGGYENSAYLTDLDSEPAYFLNSASYKSIRRDINSTSYRLIRRDIKLDQSPMSSVPDSAPQPESEVLDHPERRARTSNFPWLRLFKAFLLHQAAWASKDKTECEHATSPSLPPDPAGHYNSAFLNDEKSPFNTTSQGPSDKSKTFPLDKS